MKTLHTIHGSSTAISKIWISYDEENLQKLLNRIAKKKLAEPELKVFLWIIFMDQAR